MASEDEPLSNLEIVQDIVEDPEIKQTLWLVRNGIPFDVAFALEPNKAKAWAIIFGIFEGGEYNWKEDRWIDRD